MFQNKSLFQDKKLIALVSAKMLVAEATAASNGRAMLRWAQLVGTIHGGMN